jgi:hypothetical protein
VTKILITGAYGFIGKIEETINLKLTDDYKNFIRQFQERIQEQNKLQKENNNEKL